jgi:hypothetical protein
LSRIAPKIASQGSPFPEESVFISRFFQRTIPLWVAAHTEPSASTVKPANRPGNGKIVAQDRSASIATPVDGTGNGKISNFSWW